METLFLGMTVVLSAASAGIATYRLNVSKERLTFRARKAEEAYCTAESVDAELTQFFDQRYSLIGDSARSLDDTGMARATEQFARLKMLVGFYFPSLSNPLSRAVLAASTSYRSLKAFEQAADDGEQQRLMQLLDGTVVDLKDALESLKGAILAAGSLEDATRPLGLFRRPARPAPVRRVMEVPA